MKTMTVTKLDPAYKIHHMSVSSEHEKPLYYDVEGHQIPLIEVEVPYKPEYDAESGKINHWFFKREVVYYRDVYIQIGKFKARNNFDHLVKGIAIVWFDRLIGRHIGLGTDTRLKHE